jgi:redox-sensitive bicupin YhaK (pirin superfamily)
MKKLVIIFLLIPYAISYRFTYAEEAIGIIAVAIGTVNIERNEAPISAEQGSSVFQNDIIITGGQSRAQILLLDQTAINISQKANLKIDHFVL